MKLFLRYISIISIVIFAFPILTFSSWLVPPKLTEVIKTNEKLQKIQARKLRVLKMEPIVLLEETLSYRTVKSTEAIKLNRYDTIDMLVQEINLSKWGYFQSLLNLWWYDELTGEPLFQKNKLTEIVQTLDKKPFSLINGQFFDPSKKITPLSFGLKMDGVVRTAWADNRDESKNILVINKWWAQILPYSWDNLRDAEWYLAMVNLSLNKPKFSSENIGRTYICLKNPDTSNKSSEVLIFTAKAITESVIEKELLRWWCTRNSSSKLDSSGSTQLWVDGEFVYGNSHKWNPDYRWIPHTIAIYE